MEYNIRIFPEPCLRKKADTVKQFDADLRFVISQMERIMKSQKHGIGLAAPQVGLSIKLAIVDVSSRVASAKKICLINPIILNESMPKVSREGCMSVPDYSAIVKRYENIRVRWQDEKGAFHEGEFTGIEAVCIQHEIDHLNGLLIIDRVTSLKRDLIPRK